MGGGYILYSRDMLSHGGVVHNVKRVLRMGRGGGGGKRGILPLNFPLSSFNDGKTPYGDLFLLI